MILEHCTNIRFKAYDVWFLQDIIKDNQTTFEKRKLFFGVCPKCNKKVIVLEEYRKSDNKYFYTKSDKEHSKIYKNIIKNEKNRIIYTLVELNNHRGQGLTGFVYGVNKEIKNKNGEVVQIRQYACSLKSNQRTLIKRKYL